MSLFTQKSEVSEGKATHLTQCFLSLFLRSRTSDHTEDGNSRFHASTHPRDAGELGRRGGPRQRSGKSKEGETYGARKPSSKSISETCPLPEPQPCVRQPLTPIPLRLNSRTHFVHFPENFTHWGANSRWINRANRRVHYMVLCTQVWSTGFKRNVCPVSLCVQLTVWLCNILYIKWWKK